MNFRLVLLLVVCEVAVLVFVAFEHRQDLPVNCPSEEREVSVQNESGRNIVTVYTGRWKFLRIQLPHIYRELQRNGGVVDEVWFMMVNCDKETRQHLLQFVEVANAASKHSSLLA